MAESADDTAVDRAIARLQEAVTELQSAQKKDVKDEDSEEYDETPREEQPKDLRTATVRVREHMRTVRRRAREAQQ